MRTYGDLLTVRTVPAALARDASLVVGGSLLVALCAKVQVWPSAVPITLQTFGVLMVGALLGKSRGASALLLYLIEGAVGLPVFAGGMAGPAYLMGPTAGFLLAFPVSAFIVGSLAERGWDRRFTTAAAAMLIGDAIILGVGFAWLANLRGVMPALEVGIKPIIVLDLLKIAAATALLPVGWKVLGLRT